MRTVSGKRMCQILESRGWRRARVTGSHHIYIHPDVPEARVSVPVHSGRDMRPGTQRDVMKRAGLADGDL